MAYAMADSRLNLIDLAFTMTTYTYGPLLGVMIMSMMGMRRGYLVLPAALMSIVLVVIVNHPGLILPLETVSEPLFAWPWLFPMGTLCCLLLAMGSDSLGRYWDRLKMS